MKYDVRLKNFHIHLVGQVYFFLRFVGEGGFPSYSLIYFLISMSPPTFLLEPVQRFWRDIIKIIEID